MYLTNVLSAYSCAQHSAVDKVMNKSERTYTTERVEEKELEGKSRGQITQGVQARLRRFLLNAGTFRLISDWFFFVVVVDFRKYHLATEGKVDCRGQNNEID